jgi:hypothetical protein
MATDLLIVSATLFRASPVNEVNLMVACLQKKYPLLFSLAVDFVVFVVESSQFDFIHHFFSFVNGYQTASLVHAWVLRILAVFVPQVIRQHCQEHAEDHGPSHEELRHVRWKTRIRFETSGASPSCDRLVREQLSGGITYSGELIGGTSSCAPATTSILHGTSQN